VTLPYDTRPHRWEGGVCARCAMRQSWAGARQPCGGIAPPKPAKGKGRRYDPEANAARRERREAALGLEAVRAEWRERDKRRRERRAETEARR
jgi:hypothetical protein